jgi:50S ribosomal protein L16 3-hydroxylase
MPSIASASAPERPPRAAAAPDTLLGGHSVAAFLRGFWHKEALLVRAAVPGFAGLFTAAELESLALRDDVESRLVIREGRRWAFEHGPFRRADFRSLPPRNWTLLVQGVNLHDAAADALLRGFAFLPYARLDDLMVSYAVPGGGVGPHFDSYDVFLLQGFGRRRWRYGPQDDLGLKPGLPVKILRRFTPAHDAVLAPGDMLYLPPHCAHDGVAVDECTTYSIGFRAPGSTELATAFLDFLRDEVDLDGRYADPDLAPTAEPARIGAAMVGRCARDLARLRWSPATVARFLGCWLSEPKPTVIFEPPPRPLTRAAFARTLAKAGARLDRRTQLLYDRHHLFINGSALAWPADAANALALRRLANARRIDARTAATLPVDGIALLHRWYCDGYLDTAAG